MASPIINRSVRKHPTQSHFAPCTQGAEASGGMVNIRADEELTPEEVLQGFSEADADDVVAMSRDPQVSARVCPI